MERIDVFIVLNLPSLEIGITPFIYINAFE